MHPIRPDHTTSGSIATELTELPPTPQRRQVAVGSSSGEPAHDVDEDMPAGDQEPPPMDRWQEMMDQ